jgi:hypothetical protein
MIDLFDKTYVVVSVINHGECYGDWEGEEMKNGVPELAICINIYRTTVYCLCEDAVTRAMLVVGKT